jgi:hypothetical protein
MVTCKKEVNGSRKCQCPWNEDQLKVYLEDLLAMYEQGIYDLSILTVMLPDCPGFNAGEFIRENVPYEKRLQEIERIKKYGNLPYSALRMLEELYFGSFLKKVEESRTHDKDLGTYYAVLKSRSSCHVAEGLHMNKIPVVFRDNHHDIVSGNELDRLLETGKIKAFRRSTGWVVIGRDTIRGNGGNYIGPERRMPGIRTSSQRSKNMQAFSINALPFPG